MKILLSPAKRMKLQHKGNDVVMSKPCFEKEALSLATQLRDMDSSELGKVLGITGKTLFQTCQTYMHFSGGGEQVVPAVFAFSGTAYSALDAESFTQEELAFAANHLRLFSGLYGLLRPGDLIEPYRLDVADGLITFDGGNLYQFWGSRINQLLVEEGGNELIFNLASEEYSKLIDPTKFPEGSYLTLSFKEFRDGKLKSVSPAVKTARGMMARYIITHQITNRECVKLFDQDGYLYSPDHSTESEYVFIR